METGLAINKLSNLLRRRSAQILKTVGISGAQGSVLDFLLVSPGPVCQRDVEQEFGLRPSTASELLQTMEKSGLIRRLPDPADARRKNLEPDPQAAAVCSALRQEITGTETLLLQGISEAEKQQFLATARKMLQNLQEATQ